MKEGGSTFNHDPSHLRIVGLTYLFVRKVDSTRSVSEKLVKAESPSLYGKSVVLVV